MALSSYRDHIENLTKYRSALLNGSHLYPLNINRTHVYIGRKTRTAILFKIEQQLARFENSRAKVLQLLTGVKRPGSLKSHFFDI